MPAPPPYAYVVTADAVAPGHLDARYQIAAGAADGAVRFADPGLRSDGLVHELGVETGLVKGLSAGAYGLMDTTDGVRASGGAYVQAAWSPGTPRVAGRVGVVRELDGFASASAWLVGGLRSGPVDATVDLQFEKRFAPGADPVDLVVPVAASVEVAPGIRVGAEYVGQDLEEYGDPDDIGAEGGPVQVAALVAGASVLNDALQVAVAPGYAVGATAHGFVARGSVTWRF